MWTPLFRASPMTTYFSCLSHGAWSSLQGSVFQGTSIWVWLWTRSGLPAVFQEGDRCSVAQRQRCVEIKGLDLWRQIASESRCLGLWCRNVSQLSDCTCYMFFCKMEQTMRLSLLVSLRTKKLTGGKWACGNEHVLREAVITRGSWGTCGHLPGHISWIL